MVGVSRDVAALVKHYAEQLFSMDFQNLGDDTLPDCCAERLDGLEEWSAVWKMLLGTFVVFMISCTGEALVAMTEIASGALAVFMVS